LSLYKKNIILLCVIAVTGCTAAGDREQMFSDGTVRIEPATEAGYDNRISILNKWGMTYDFAKKKDRTQAVADFLAQKCRSTNVVKETSFQQGTYIFGKPKKTIHPRR